MSWKLGRVAGIDVFLHPTFLLILFFPQVAELGVYGLMFVLAAFGCVLLHELGHALMARRYGIETVDITLYPIGGVARLSRMPRSPGAELLVALAGPAVNLAIALGLAVVGGLGMLLPLGFAADGGLGDFAASLTAVNLFLALFNLVPAFPMDGGRVLRALLSGWLGRWRATEVAAALGRTLAVVFGVASFLSGAWFQVALAAFIYLAAGAELASVAREERARGEWGRGVWFAPPGYRWEPRGDGQWQLCPIVVRARDRGAAPWL
jgi:Zn-dependent protease